MNIKKILMDELSLESSQVNNVIKLLDEGNTIPFIARYRKEMTKEMDDEQLRNFEKRLTYLKNLKDRKEEIIDAVTKQEKLTKKLEEKIKNAKTMSELEDLYRPYKKKKRTRATVAKEKGLEPLANYILLNQGGNYKKQAQKFLSNKKDGVNTYQEAIEGAKDIIAEMISDNADYRKYIKQYVYANGKLVSESKTKEDTVYRNYYNYSEGVKKIPSHRVLAIDRGEKEKILSVKIDVDDDFIINYLTKKIMTKEDEIIKETIVDSYKRLIFPSVEREIRSNVTKEAQDKSMKVFARNLEGLLMSPPVKGRCVLGLDPAYRTGCKLAVVDDTGKVLYTNVIYPTPPQNKIEESEKVIKELCIKFGIDVIAIGNGTATKETEIFVVKAIKKIDRKIYYIVVSEAGASVYSASELATKEFPDFDVSLRSAVSIARRLQDPLAELVKIDPKAIGVGQYQHDMNQKALGETLSGVVEKCVNQVGIDINTASVSLLSYISGINSNVAENLIEYRENNGKFKSRNELKKVKGLGEKSFQQSAGFLRISESKNVLDNTSVHPEVYDKTTKLITFLGYDKKDKRFNDIKSRAKLIGIDKIAKEISIGIPTLNDIIDELQKPGRDPRDELPKIELRQDILDIKDLKEGMRLKGTVRNVADFGAFVDLGVHQDGLVHISKLSKSYVKNPMDVVKVGDIVDVVVLSIDVEKKRISLSMVD